MIEPGGILGVTPAVVVPLSEGRELVSHFRNVNAYGRFWWICDGELRVEFDPMFPNDRTGSTPDHLVDEMAEVGFDVAPSDTGAAETKSRFADLSEPWVGPVAGSFALAERLTRVAVSRALLDEATFFCGESRSLGEGAPSPRQAVRFVAHDQADWPAPRRSARRAVPARRPRRSRRL
jgi:hypothetical protein